MHPLGSPVEELDKAKKDLAEIRAKSGLPDDDAKPDLERLMEEEKRKISTSSRLRRDCLFRHSETVLKENTILPWNK